MFCAELLEFLAGLAPGLVGFGYSGLLKACILCRRCQLFSWFGAGLGLVWVGLVIVVCWGHAFCLIGVDYVAGLGLVWVGLVSVVS